MDADEIRRLWGSGVQPVSADLSAFSAPTRDFLATVGMPVAVVDDLELRFYRDERLGRPVSLYGTDYLALGEDLDALYVIEVDTDAVWSVFPDGDLPARFVNTNVAYFVLFLGLFRADLLHSLERDPGALSRLNRWWKMVLDDR